MNEPRTLANDASGSFSKVKTDAIKIVSECYIANSLSIEVLEKTVASIEKSESIQSILETLNHVGINEKQFKIQMYSEIPQFDKISTLGSRKTIDNERLITKVIQAEIAHTKVVLDYSNIALPDGEYELQFSCKHSKCDIFLPDGISIENRLEEVFSKTIDKRKARNAQSTVLLRFSGNLVHSKITIKKAKRKKNV